MSMWPYKHQCGWTNLVWVIRMRARELSVWTHVDGRVSATVHACVIACRRYMGFLDFTPLLYGAQLDISRASSLRAISTMVGCLAALSVKRERVGGDSA